VTQTFILVSKYHTKMMQTSVYTQLSKCSLSTPRRISEETLYWQPAWGTACDTGMASVPLVVVPELRKRQMAIHIALGSAPHSPATERLSSFWSLLLVPAMPVPPSVL